MIRQAAAALAFAWITSSAADAQGAVGDPRVETLDYAPNRSWSINTASDVTTLVIVNPGARIDTVVMSDPGAYQVGVSPVRDALYVRPRRSDARGTMTVSAGPRLFTIELTSDAAAPAPYVVAFRDAPAAPDLSPPQNPQQVATASGIYKLAGDKSLRPLSVSNDGSKTYIRWAPDQPIPAVFALEAAGHEETINGYMRDGAFTIDRVYDRLIFRIDKRQATATRSPEKRSS